MTSSAVVSPDRFDQRHLRTWDLTSSLRQQPLFELNLAEIRYFFELKKVYLIKKIFFFIKEELEMEKKTQRRAYVSWIREFFVYNNMADVEEA